MPKQVNKYGFDVSITSFSHWKVHPMHIDYSSKWSFLYRVKLSPLRESHLKHDALTLFSIALFGELIFNLQLGHASFLNF